MQDINSSNDNNNEVDIKELFQILLISKWIIVSITAFFSVFGIVYSLLLPNIYESRALLAPSSSNESSGLIQNYGSLANLAGIDISEDSENNAAQAIEKIKTLSFFESNILPNIYLPDLMAYKSWNSETNTSTYDDKIFDKTSNTWVQRFSSTQKLNPSAQESFDVFIKNHLNISTNKKNNFVTVKIQHQSPYIAKEWTKLSVDQINSLYRKKDKNKAERASNYLNMLLAETNLVEIKEVLATLLQQETKKLTLIEANEYYVYEFIDPPAVMEKKSQPQRALICILAALFGGMSGVIFVFVRHYLFADK